MPIEVAAQVAFPDEQIIHSAKVEFLRILFEQLLGKQQDRFQSFWLNGYVTDAVKQSLPELSSVAEVVTLCEAAGIDNSYRQAISHIRHDPFQMTSETKVALHTWMKDSALSSDIEYLPPLASEDYENLRIRWDIADVEYTCMRADALERCPELALSNVTRVVTRWRFEQIINELKRVLANKLTIDTSRVISDAGELSPYHLSMIRNRAQREYSEFQYLLFRLLARRFTRDTARRLELSGYSFPVVDEAEITAHVKKCLQPFQDWWEKVAKPFAREP